MLQDYGRTLLILTLLAAGLLGGCSMKLIDEQDVVVMADEQFGQMRAELEISADEAVRSYVICVADAIIATLEPPYSELDWDVEIFDNEMVNAFAMPGGKIGVFTGLLQAARNQDQLAAVLGHEVAHVTEQHSLDRANASVWQQIGAQTAEIGGILILGQSGVGNAVNVLSQYGLMMPFGRGQESDADIVGLGYMADAGFEPAQSIQLWINMREVSGDGPPEFMSTHPSSETRIKDLNHVLLSVRSRYEQARATGRTPDCGP